MISKTVFNIARIFLGKFIVLNNLESQTTDGWIFKVGNKVDTTYRCEALKEVMSFKCVKSQILKYLFTKHLHTKDTKCFRYFKMIYISQTFDMKDIIDYVINRIVKVYNGYLPIQVSNHYTIAINRILKLSTWLLTYRTIYLLLEMLRI